MFRGRIAAENQLDMFLCCRFLLRPPQFPWISFAFSSLFLHVISLTLFFLKQSKPFFQVFAFLFLHIYFSRKQITEDDKAMEASVVLSLSANDAHFSQTLSMITISTVDSKNTHEKSNASLCLLEHTLFTDALYNLIYCNDELQEGMFLTGYKAHVGP